MNLETEISEFWKWAKTTPNEYVNSRGIGEWETEYPDWDKLSIAIDKAIIELNRQYEVHTAEFLIQGLAIDNESELTLEKIKDRLIGIDIFIEQIIDSNHPQAKWQIAELLGTFQIENAIQYLGKLIEDKDKYVKRRALISLNKIDSTKAKLLAEEFNADKDDYLRVISNKILSDEMEH